MAENKERSKKAEALGLKYDFLNDCYVECSEGSSIGTLHKNDDKLREITVFLSAAITYYDGRRVYVKDSYPVLKDTSLELSEESQAPEDNPCLYIYIPELNDGLYLADDMGAPIVDISAFSESFCYEQASSSFAEIEHVEYVSKEELVGELDEDWKRKIEYWKSTGSSVQEKLLGKFVEFDFSEFIHKLNELLSCTIWPLQYPDSFKNYIKIQSEDDRIYGCATNGRVVLKYKLNAKNDWHLLGDKPVFVSKDLATYFLSLNLNEPTVQIGTAYGNFCIKCGNVVLGEKISEVKYPDAGRMFSIKQENTLNLTAAQFDELLQKNKLDSVIGKAENVLVLKSEQFKNLTYYTEIDEDGLYSPYYIVPVFNTSNKDLRKIIDFYPINYEEFIRKIAVDFGPFKISAVYVELMAELCNSGDVVLKYSDAKHPVLFEGKDFEFVVMPL